MRRRSLRIIAVSLALTSAATALPAAGAQASTAACASGNAHPAQIARSQARVSTLCLLNRERHARGLDPLRLNRRLTTASIRHSRNMVRKDFFDHGNFVARIMNARYAKRQSAWSLGENIAWGTGGLATPAQIVQGWMNSPGHRANILNRRFRDIGIGIVVGAPGVASAAANGATYTTDFGRKG